MPRVKVHNCESLKKTCVKYVANNINYWYDKKSTNEIDILRSDTPEFISPFELLPLPVLKEIIALIQKRRGITIVRYVKLFLTYHLDSLKLLVDYAGSMKNENTLVVNLASIRCLQMKSLQIKGYPYGDDFMAFAIPKFVNLQVLNISNTSAGDITLQLLGKYCKHLKELIAERCSHITDAGMQGLCVSVDHLGKEVEGIGQCKLLEHLATDDTRITSVGVKLGIRNLPKLKRWKMVSAQLLAEVYQEDSMSYKLLETPKYSLIHLDVKGTQYASGSLGLAVSMCPFATQVNIITVKSLTDSDLQALLSLKGLHELQFNGCNYEDECEITFSGGVTPLLKAFGSSSLKFLKLSCFPQVNIDVIIQYCPNLHSLNLEQNYHYSTASPEEEEVNSRSPMVMQLQKLDISTSKNPSKRIPTENILSLFSIPSIKKISCWYCTTITDEILKQAARLHQFKNLESLELAVCASIPRKITSSHILAWEKQASSNYWDLAIHYEEYSSEFESSEYEMDFEDIGANVA
uniref:Uncharacterized protein n=1 Tax=Daphnia galeata TaxID=27404 RepID=A0A8J2W3U9_9CRUS|nr:unnamed protein product [Daphnia galeata]